VDKFGLEFGIVVGQCVLLEVRNQVLQTPTKKTKVKKTADPKNKQKDAIARTVSESKVVGSEKPYLLRLNRINTCRIWRQYGIKSKKRDNPTQPKTTQHNTKRPRGISRRG
jgi:hypothetical protein